MSLMNTKECQSHTVKRSEKLTHDLTIRLKKIEGQIRGINGMVEKEIYCDDILTQISSVQSALASVSKQLLENHLRTCVADKINAGDPEIIDEFVKTLARVLRK
jgi:DNA-binding FrmR family transcriptional regulator